MTEPPSLFSPDEQERVDQALEVFRAEYRRHFPAGGDEQDDHDAQRAAMEAVVNDLVASNDDVAEAVQSLYDVISPRDGSRPDVREIALAAQEVHPILLRAAVPEPESYRRLREVASKAALEPCKTLTALGPAEGGECADLLAWDDFCAPCLARAALQEGRDGG